MKLEFSLLVIDDNPTDLAQNVFGQLEDFLSVNGFSLKQTVPPDISPNAIEALAQAGGAEYDLVIIDYMLGANVPDGSFAAATFRRLMPYTDIIFYSSSPPRELLEKLADQEVAGVFVANRANTLGDTMEGVAETIIRKAVDLTHMRGIVMATVAEFDVQLEKTLHDAFSSGNANIAIAATRTFDELVQGKDGNVANLKILQQNGEILSLVRSANLFSLQDKYEALNRVAKALAVPGRLKQADFDIIKNRNLLAHAREILNEDNKLTLISITSDNQEIAIDDAWMTRMRTDLHEHRATLDEICATIDAAIA